jgi:secondary thiamine-phosphate synthase enzyme
MAVTRDVLEVSTAGEGDILDLTDLVQASVGRSGIGSGLACVFVPGSTAAVTTIEHEPGLLQDLPAALERLAPAGVPYRHDEAWHDGNGRSHVRAAVMGPSLTVPFTDGRLELGTWQQVVLVELDVRPRRRRLVLQLIGE